MGRNITYNLQGNIAGDLQGAEAVDLQGTEALCDDGTPGVIVDTEGEEGDPYCWIADVEGQIFKWLGTYQYDGFGGLLGCHEGTGDREGKYCFCQTHLCNYDFETAGL